MVWRGRLAADRPGRSHLMVVVGKTIFGDEIYPVGMNPSIPAYSLSWCVNHFLFDLL